MQLQKILTSYSPWGKPGGGAPCAATLRKKNVPLEPPELPRRCHSYGQVKPLGTDCCVCSRHFFFHLNYRRETCCETLPHKKSDSVVSDDRMHVSENFQVYCLRTSRWDACENGVARVVRFVAAFLMLPLYASAPELTISWK